MHDEHRAYLYESDVSLIARVAPYVDEALAASGVAIVLARRPIVDGVAQALAARGHDVAALRASGRYFDRDANAVLDEIRPTGYLDRDRFRALAGGLLEQARAACGDAPIHVYGEVVDVLWERKAPESALALEHLWHELAHEHRFALLCGYRLGRFDRCHLRELDAICAMHDDAFLDVGPGTEPEVIGKVHALQQRAQRLETEIARRERIENRMLRLLAIGGRLAAARSRDEVARLIVDEAVSVLGTTSATLWLAEDDKLVLAAKSERVPGPVERYTTIEPGSGALVSDAVRRRESLFIGSRAEYAARYPESYARVAPRLDGEIALAILPLATESRPYGVVCFSFDRARTFEHTDRAFKSILARQGGLALERLDLVAQERAQRDAEKRARVEAELLYGLTATVNSVDDLDAIYDLALDAAMRGSHSQRAAILVFDDDNVMRFKASRGLSTTYRNAVEGHSPWRAGEPDAQAVVVDDTETDPAWLSYRDVFRAEGIRAIAFLPLIHHHKLIGKLMLYRDEPRGYTQRELQLTSTIAIHVAQAIERKRAEREVARAYREERDAHLLADEATRAREEILSVVSHDLRNPLGTIMMGASTLLSLDLGEKGQRARTIGERIHRQAERMARLIEDLVDFAGIQAGRLAIARGRHAPESIVAATKEIFGPIAQERGLVFEATAAPNLPAIECDSDRAVQVLSNLVSNALKVTPKGGKILIGAEPKDQEIVFYVRDTGPGIEPEELPNLFERFWRSKKSTYKGAGLGLSIARGIVDAHGGRIWAESKPGTGSTFYFSLSSLRNN